MYLNRLFIARPTPLRTLVHEATLIKTKNSARLLFPYEETFRTT